MTTSHTLLLLSPSATHSQLTSLPAELLLHLLSYLDIPDLLSISRTSHLLRQHSLDPLLHSFRLHRASGTISRYIPLRPSLAELMAHRIYVTRTTVAARALGRNLISIRLNRKLGTRPSVQELVRKGVLPEECYGLGRGMGVAPALVGVKRRVERERVKDLLRGWVGEWRRRGMVVDRHMDMEGRGDGQKIDVRRMARRFARERDAGVAAQRQNRWGPGAGRVVEMPTRAKVLGLRRFWERVGRDGVAN